MADPRGEIENLIFSYAERMDAGDIPGVARLFEHAEYRAGDGPAMTWEQVEAVNREVVILHEDGTPRTKHVTTNLKIEIDPEGDRATCRSYFTVIQGIAGAPLQPIVAGRYHDRFECVAGTWRFRERQIHVDLVGDVSQHLRISL